MEKICPRCNKKFECREDKVQECLCSSVKLTVEAQEYIKERYAQRCLCVDCLNKILSIFVPMQRPIDRTDEAE